MKFIKKNYKLIIGIVVGILLTSMVSVYAAYNYLSTDVEYTKSDGTTISVKEALDELYMESTGGIIYKDTTGKKQKLSATTAVGTKIGTTTVDGQTLDWYLFDVSDDGKTAYLVSTPTYWVPDTTNEVSGAYTPKLVSASNSNTGAIRQAIQKKPSGTSWSSYTYESSRVTYTPSDNTLNYFKSVNSQWSEQRGSTAFESLNENEQCACYLADSDIFLKIKDQVNSSDGNLKGKIKTLVGGASAEQWCKAYYKQSAAKDHKITCEYRATSVPGYIYKVNDKQSTVSNSDYRTGTNTIFGNDIYGAANKNGDSSNPFYSYWWLASPSSYGSSTVCLVYGRHSDLDDIGSNYCNYRVSLFAGVAL